MRPCYADGRTSTEPTDSTVSRIACWTICLDGVTEMENRHGAHLMHVEVPTHTLRNADPETTNTHDTTETSRTWLWISFAKKQRHRTTNRFYSTADSCTHTSH